MKDKHVAVPCGGFSSERPVSLAFGRECAGAPQGEGGRNFPDYDPKYVADGSKRECPTKFSPNIYQKIETLGPKAHQAIGCRGVTRSDFRFDDSVSPEGELVRLEVNTQPGMTPTSLVPELALHSGRSFGEPVRWMVEDASCSR